MALALGIASALSARAQPAPERMQPPAWLAGCWASTLADRSAGSGEHWMPPAAGSMPGMARTLRVGRPAEHEFMHIRPDAQGRLVYLAMPSGQTPTAFLAVSVDHESAVFENPDHDFPQRVIYRLQGPDQLQARIEGLRNGRLRGVDFPMRRVACESLGGK